MSNNINFDYKNLSPFKWFVLENFPFIEADFDALTEWQLFCKLGKEMNKIIDSQNLVGEQAETLTNAFNNLKNYVDNYFENLDVQDEINNKLNEMAEDGTLTTLIGNYVNPIFQNYQITVNNRLDNQDMQINNRLDNQDMQINNRLDNQDIQINNLTTQITSVSSGAPIPASSTSDMTNTSKIYVNTTDGKLYYYNGTNWVAFGTYQSTSIGENTISYKMFDDFLKNSMGITIPSVTITNGSYLNDDKIIQQSGCSYTSPIELKKGQRLIAIVRGYQHNVSLLVKCDSDGNNRTKLIQSTDNTDVVINYVAKIDMYVMLCSTSNDLSYYYIDENLKYKLSNLSEIVTNIDLGEITNNTYINKIGNVAHLPNGIYSSSDYIDILPSKNYKLTGINWTSTDDVGYAFYDKNKNFISFVKNPVENNFLITSPSKAYYIRLTLKTSTIINTSFCIITNLVEIENEISNLSEGTDDLTNIDLGEITNNTYINKIGNVAHLSIDIYSSSDYIDILPAKNYKLTGINWTSTEAASTEAVGYAFYDKNKNFISFVKNPVENNFLITSPFNAYYIRLTLKTSTIMNTNFYIITNLVEIENEIDNLNNNVDIEKFDLFRSFNSFGVIGDSLASGSCVSVVDGETHYVDNYNYSWGQFIAKKYGMKCINFSAGGLTTRSWLKSPSGLSKLQNEDNKCNAYIIGLGANDYTLGSSYIGTSSDIHVDNPSLNEDTFYGNYGKIISNIKLVQPKAKIFLFTCPDQTIPSNRDYSNLNTAIRTIATLFTNVYIIDLASEYNSYFNSGFMASNLRGGHYNAISYSYIGDMLFDWLSTYMKNNYTDFRQIEFIGTDYNYYD